MLTLCGLSVLHDTLYHIQHTSLIIEGINLPSHATWRVSAMHTRIPWYVMSPGSISLGLCIPPSMQQPFDWWECPFLVRGDHSNPTVALWATLVDSHAVTALWIDSWLGMWWSGSSRLTRQAWMLFIQRIHSAQLSARARQNTLQRQCSSYKTSPFSLAIWSVHIYIAKVGMLCALAIKAPASVFRNC